MKMEFMDFEGKVAIVTGAGSARGLGIAACKQFAGYGANVVIADIDEEGAKANAKMIEETYGTKALAVKVDLCSEDSIKAMVKTTIDTFGKVDILVNNAGVSIPHAYDEISLEEWNKIGRAHV